MKSEEQPEEEPGSASQEARAVCDTIRCADPDHSLAVCEALWGAASGKPYSIAATCAGSTTNSDCVSECFRNHCMCGSTNAAAPDCSSGSRTGTRCVCGTSGIIAHRYWCCGGDTTTTYQGFSDCNHCGGEDCGSSSSSSGP